MPPPRRRGEFRPHGQIRQSQIVTTFGPGAMVDLPDHSVIIGGLDNWSGYRDRPIFEERLAAKVTKLLHAQSVEFFAPPADRDEPNAPITGITAWQFPEWFIAQYEVQDGGSPIRSRPLVHRSDLVKGQYEIDRKKYKVVPVRFVQACTRGHVSDIHWRVFVHGKEDSCRRNLWLAERGTSGELTDIVVRCECGKFKELSAATKPGDVPLGYCNGPRPWLGNYSKEQCGGAGEKAQTNRLLIRSASNAYFAQTMSVISIPEAGSAVKAAVDAVWQDFLQYAESQADVSKERRRQKVSAALEGLSDDDVWKEVQRRQSGTATPATGIRDAEIETLLSADEIGSNGAGSDFYARAVKFDGARGPMRHVSRVVKIHRLREVIAQVGFTRFEAAVPDVNGELELGVERAALSLNESWLPAVENRGEGVFIGIKRESVDAWLERDAVKKRCAQLQRGFDAWKKDNSASKATFIGHTYVMLHTLSHLLITAVSLDCGYAASSIRERIYAVPSGLGILLYTSSPDAEGTLGGLVEAANRLPTYLDRAIALGELCSNDPVCAQHRPDSQEEGRYLLGAACHGCVLLPESSCERRNDYLDRALVVPTVAGDGAAFFEGD
ncbi:MAG TPA: DUF1998 domain-containing protein [Vicinamibacterales bacterium]|nr:DUF1998 domain-containing protein [Vicinamibacterales bacterium]